jgi:hypothetical protein
VTGTNFTVAEVPEMCGVNYSPLSSLNHKYGAREWINPHQTPHTLFFLYRPCYHSRLVRNGATGTQIQHSVGTLTSRAEQTGGLFTELPDMPYHHIYRRWCLQAHVVNTAFCTILGSYYPRPGEPTT